MSTKSSEKSRECPKCEFTGDAKFPKGFATENIAKTDENGAAVYLNGKQVFVQINRCPTCGYKELQK